MGTDQTVQEVEALRKENEALRTELEKLKTDYLLASQILSHMYEGVNLVRTSDAQIVYTNEHFDEMFGYDRGELVGKPISIVNAPSDIPPKEIAIEIMKQLQAQGYWHGEIQNIRKDGTIFWCHATVSTFEHAEYGTIWISIHTDISEQKQAEQREHNLQLELKKKELIRQFLIQTSHEIRTPLAIIDTSLHLLTRQHMLTTENKHVQKIERSIFEISTMLDNFSLMNDLDRTNEIEKETIDLHYLSMNLIEQMKEYTQFKKIEIQFKAEQEHDDWMIAGHYAYLEIALKNLLRNAIQFTKQNGTIIMQLAQHYEQIVVRVIDTGMGMSQEDLENIFERFYRVDKVGQHRGFGLGLPIVKRIIELHDGFITVDSQLNAGSVFEIHFPIRATSNITVK